MKQFGLNMGIMLATMSLLTGCQTMPGHSENARINAAIKGRLAQEQIDLSRVGVDTQDGSVYLSGVVPSSDHKVRAEQIARAELAASPVINWAVFNQLHVKPILDDAAISASVRGRLINDRLINASQIGVETQQGVVTLYGLVPSLEQKMRAELLTRDTQGVYHVMNSLQVASSMPPTVPSTSMSPPIPTDTTITATIKDKLTADRVANLARVHVDTTEGIVYLTGVVPSNDHKVRAEQVARDVRGVNQVVNNLQVQP